MDNTIKMCRMAIEIQELWSPGCKEEELLMPVRWKKSESGYELFSRNGVMVYFVYSSSKESIEEAIKTIEKDLGIKKVK